MWVKIRVKATDTNYKLPTARRVVTERHRHVPRHYSSTQPTSASGTESSQAACAVGMDECAVAPQQTIFIYFLFSALYLHLEFAVVAAGGSTSETYTDEQ